MYRQKRKTKWRSQRYGDYYARLMEEVRLEHYNEYIKRIRALRKEVILLGEVPKNQKQLIKTIQYFRELINLATKFVDKGLLDCVPIEKAEKLEDFNSTITTLTCRSQGIVQVQNKTPVGKPVTNNTLYIGMLSKITGEPNESLRTETINGRVYQVEVYPAPISDWINFRVKDIKGRMSLLKQGLLAGLCEDLTKILLGSIDDVLKEV